MTEPVDKPPIVWVTEATVREFRVRFTGTEAYRGPVEVLAYGRLVGHWFPPGTLPATVAPRSASGSPQHQRRNDPGLRPVRPRRGPGRPASAEEAAAALSEKQRQRDAWLRKLNSSRTKGSGY